MSRARTRTELACIKASEAEARVAFERHCAEARATAAAANEAALRAMGAANRAAMAALVSKRSASA